MSHSTPPVSPTDALAGSVPTPASALRPSGDRRPVEPAEAGTPPGLRKPITPGAALLAIRRQWSMALVLGLVFGALAGAAVWTLRPDKYTSFALLRVSSADTGVLKAEDERPQDAQNYLRTQLALIKSRPVLKTALRDEKVRQLPIIQRQPDPVEWLDREMVVEQIPATEAIRVSLTVRGGGSDLQLIVNAVVTAYLDDVVRLESQRQQKHLFDLEKVHSGVEKNLRDLRAAFSALSKDLRGADPTILVLKQKQMLEDIRDKNTAIAVLKGRCRDLDLKIVTYGSRLMASWRSGSFGQFAALCLPRDAQPAISGTLDALVERELDADPSVAELAKRVRDVQDEILDFEQKSANANSSGRAILEKKLATAQAAVERAKAERRPVVAAKQAALSDASVRQSLSEAELERRKTQEQIDELQREVGVIKADLDKLGQESADLDFKRTEIDRNEKFLQTVWDQKERLQAELKGSADRKRVVLVSAADREVVLNTMGRLQESLAGGLAGATLGLLGLAAADIRRNRIYTLCDVSQGLQLRVIGGLPTVSLWGGRGGLGGLGERAAVESVNGLRTALARAAKPAGKGQAILVVSASPREGKSTLTTQLAASFARAKRKTLLIDCDLRAPSLHRLFGLEYTPGMCELLTAATTLDAAVRPSGVDHLDLLPAGKFCSAAESALAHRAVVQAIVDEARGKYDVVVIDSSPVLLVPDALMVAECVDGLVLSVRSGVSRAPQVYAGYERFAEFRVPLLGVVVNGVQPTEIYAYGYGVAADPASAAL